MAASTTALEDLPLPHRVAVARVLTDALATERALARLYATFAAYTTLASLEAALTELARAKAARVAELEAWLGPAAAAAAAAPPDGVPTRDVFFARAFQGERALEVGYRELGGLLGGAARLPGLPELLAGATRQREQVRRLYVRYS
jgi:hypothetical protein